MGFINFMLSMFTDTCMAPGCDKEATSHPHGIPCCDEHYHPSDCSVWLGEDCDCGKEREEKYKPSLSDIVPDESAPGVPAPESERWNPKKWW